MPHYLLATHGSSEPPAEPPPEMTQEEMKAKWGKVVAFEEEMNQAGAFVFSAGLSGPETATVVAPDSGGLSTTDGPYLESKEFLAGFYIIKAADLDEALDWARRTVEVIGNPIEVRPMMTHEDR